MPQRDRTLHPAKWQAHIQWAACYLMFSMQGWAQVTDNHTTWVRQDGLAHNVGAFHPRYDV